MTQHEYITDSGMVLLAFPSKADTRLVRNHDMVHLRDCSVVSAVYVNPWAWAEGKSYAEIAGSRANGLRFCKKCEPLLAVLKSQDSSKGATT